MENITYIINDVFYIVNPADGEYTGSGEERFIYIKRLKMNLY